MRALITTAAALAILDKDEIVEGYRDGFRGDPEPGDNRSDSYAHGWNNGHNDRTGVSTATQTDLIRDMRRNGVWPFAAACLNRAGV